MRIHSYNQAPDVGATKTSGAQKNAKSDAKSAASESSGSTSATKVSLSSEAQALSASGGIDSAKVGVLKAAVANGTFKIDAGAIADKIVNEGE